MILLIDNYDSFVYNLARYVRELGHDAIVRRHDALTLDDIGRLAPSHIILSPGPCTPAEAGISTDVVRHFGPSIPILGVCLGHQCIGAAYGARIVRAGRPMHGKVSAVTHDGIGIFTASLILSIMVLPFISAVTRDVFETVPTMLKEATYGLGCTTWEVMWRVVLPYARSGVIGGAMLALGRALGETMAVTFVIGNAHTIAPSLFAPGTTISATIANEFTEATTPLYTSSLIFLGLILFFITFIVLACAQWMLLSLERQAGTK